MLLLQRTGVYFPALMMGSSQLPWNLGVQTHSSGLCQYTHKYIILKLKAFPRIIVIKYYKVTKITNDHRLSFRDTQCHYSYNVEEQVQSDKTCRAVKVFATEHNETSKNYRRTHINQKLPINTLKTRQRGVFLSKPGHSWRK